jgi:coenzyme PQQ precursor peptide PqqA
MTVATAAIVQASAVPLWKVIVGPRADKLKTGPERVRFLSLRVQLRGHLLVGDRRHRLRGSPARTKLTRSSRRIQGERSMVWTTPILIEICVGLEINGYLPAEF